MRPGAETDLEHVLGMAIARTVSFPAAVLAAFAFAAAALPACGGGDTAPASWSAESAQSGAAGVAGAATGSAGSASGGGVVFEPTATPRPPGQANYVTHCASCHGVSGEGQANWFQPGPDGVLPAPPHDSSGHTWHHGDGYLFLVTKRGGSAFMMPGQASGMPGFDMEMTDGEIVEVLEYIKGFWGQDEREFQASASAGDPYP